MEASDTEAVNARLKRWPQSRQGPTKGRSTRTSSSASAAGVTGKDILVFTRQFATMIDAGLPLVQCLDILGSQKDNPAFRRSSPRHQGATSSRAPPSRRAAPAPQGLRRALRPTWCEAGEVGGILDTILNRLAAYIEKNEKLKRKVKGAMVYPVDRHRRRRSA